MLRGDKLYSGGKCNLKGSTGESERSPYHCMVVTGLAPPTAETNVKPQGKSLFWKALRPKKEE